MSLIVHRARARRPARRRSRRAAARPARGPLHRRSWCWSPPGRRALAEPAALPPARSRPRGARTASARAWSSARPRAGRRAGHRRGGTREHDPWSPDALVWPLLAVVDATPARTWCRVLSQHLGHGEPGEEGDLRRGRRYAVARRLARLFASYAVQRPTLLADWEAGRDTDGAGGALDPDLDLAARALAAARRRRSTRPRRDQRHRDVARRAARRVPTRSTCPPGSRCSATPGSRSPRSSCSRRWASTATSTSGCRTPRRRCGTRSRDLAGAVPRSDDTRTSAVGHPLLASLGRDVRELERTLWSRGASALERRAGSVGPAPRPCSRWLQHDIAANATVDPATRALDAGRRLGPGARLPRPGAPGRGAARGAARPARRRPDARAPRHPGDVPRHRGLRAAGRGRVRAWATLGRATPATSCGSGWPTGRSRRPTRCSRVVGRLARPGRWPGRGEPGARPARRSDPVRRRFGFSDADLETITDWVEEAGHPLGLRRRPPGRRSACSATSRTPGASASTGVLAGVACQRRRRPVLRHDAAARRRRQHQHRPRRSPRRVLDRLRRRHRPARPAAARWPTGWRAAATGSTQLTAVARGDEWQSAQVHRS